MRINELKQQYLDIVVYKGGSLKTKDTYDFNLTSFIRYLEHKGISEISSITTQIIEDYLFELNVSLSTKALRRSSISSFFKFLHRKGFIDVNPLLISSLLKFRNIDLNTYPKKSFFFSCKQSNENQHPIIEKEI